MCKHHLKYIVKLIPIPYSPVKISNARDNFNRLKTLSIECVRQTSSPSREYHVGHTFVYKCRRMWNQTHRTHRWALIGQPSNLHNIMFGRHRWQSGKFGGWRHQGIPYRSFPDSVFWKLLQTNYSYASKICLETEIEVHSWITIICGWNWIRKEMCEL